MQGSERLQGLHCGDIASPLRALCALPALLLALAAGPTRAQAYGDPTATAKDAFGETAGAERIGLYGANEIRGFNPQNSGAYRIDGAYYSRASVISAGAVSGVSVRVGVNALQLTYPSASGIVDVHLRSYTAGDRWLEASLLSQGWFSPGLQIDFAGARKDGAWGISGGVMVFPRLVNPDRSGVRAIYAGAVPEWRSGSSRIRLVLSYGRTEYDQGLWADVAAGPSLPPTQSTRVLLPPTTAGGLQRDATVGLLTETQFADRWRVTSAFVQSEDRLSYDFTSFVYGPAAAATATLSHVAEQTTIGRTAELRVSRDFQLGPTENRVTGAVRYRRREATNSDALSADLGVISVNRPSYPALPSLPDDGRRSRNVVSQAVESLDYASVIARRLELRAGVDFTGYEQNFTPILGAVAHSRQSFLFPHASASWAVEPSLTVFASYVRSLEDSGVAPTYASNANAILPAVVAEQWEAGLRRRFGRNLTLIGAVFEVHKPTAGLRPDGAFTLLGDERHRGIELSMSGELTALTRMVVGAVGMDQTLQSFGPASAPQGRRPLGTAPGSVSANLVQTLPFARNWAADVQLRWTAAKYVDGANLLRAPDITLVNVGLRGNLTIGGAPAVLRLVVTNVLNTRGWDVTSSGAITPVDRPVAWATLTLRYGR